MAKQNQQIEQQDEDWGDKHWEVEHILCQRPTAVPEKKRGDTQYLIKYLNWEFEHCYWVHLRSIKPRLPNTPLWHWNKLSIEQKQMRYNYLNQPKEFMKLSNKEKRNIGWKYVMAFHLDILTQTPSQSRSQTISEDVGLENPHC